MIEVTGIDGRVHSFADGTTQAQIDGALEAIYGPSAARAYQAPPYQAQQTRESAPRTNNLITILAGALTLAVITLIGTMAVLMTRERPAPTLAQMPSAGPAIVTPTDQMPTNQVLGTPLAPVGPVVTPEAFAGFVATRKGGNVTVRALAAPTGGQITQLPHGAPVSVTGWVTMPDGLWRQVSIGGATGFIKGEYVSQTQPAAIAKAPAAPAAKMIPREFYGYAATKDMSSVNVRTSPDATATVTGAIPTGESVYVIGEQAGWYLIKWEGKRGWASTKYILPIEGDAN